MEVARQASAKEADDTRLGRAIGPRAIAHPKCSGIFPLMEARDAFAARLLLARAAEHSLDMQYYIWHRDLSGTLLFAALLEAAERGVRARLLLDDRNNIGDEYFDAGHEVAFVDLDVLAAGPVAVEVCQDFERYWRSDSAWPVARGPRARIRRLFQLRSAL